MKHWKKTTSWYLLILLMLGNLASTVSTTYAFNPETLIQTVPPNVVITPKTAELREELEEEVATMITAIEQYATENNLSRWQPLKPASYQMGLTTHPAIYYESPIETIYTLSQLYPYLKDEYLKSKVRRYLNDELANYPPHQTGNDYGYTHFLFNPGDSPGAKRELFPLEKSEQYNIYGNLPKRHLVLFYALWLYANNIDHQTGDWTGNYIDTHYDQLRTLYFNLKSNAGTLKTYPEIAGAIGFARITARLGKNDDYQDVLNWLNNSLTGSSFDSLNLQNMSKEERESRIGSCGLNCFGEDFETGNNRLYTLYTAMFNRNPVALHFNRDLGALIKADPTAHAQATAFSQLQDGDENWSDGINSPVPLWWLNEPSMAHGENNFALPEISWTNFLLHAYVRDTGVDQLKEWLLDPPTRVGDLLYMQKLVAAIESDRVYPEATLYVATNKLWFDSQETGTIKEQIFAVENSGETALVVNKIDFAGTDGPNFSIHDQNQCVGRSLALHERCELTLRYQPEIEGDKNAVLRIHSNDSQAGGTPKEISLFGDSAYDVVAPQADFYTLNRVVVAPERVEFTDQSVGSHLHWEWDFDGNGTIDSLLQNPSHIYGKPGFYAVTLRVSNSKGESVKNLQSYIEVRESDFGGLLKNGDMEQLNHDGSLKNWESQFGGQYSDAVGRSGNRSLQYIKENAGGFFQQHFDIAESGKTWLLTTWVYCKKHQTEGWGGSKIQIIHGWDTEIASLNGFCSADKTTETEQWQPVTLSFTPTDDQTSLKLKIVNYGTLPEYEYYLDDFEIKAAIPIAAFEYTTDSPTVRFTDSSDYQPTAWAWDFNNDGVTDSTEQNPVHTFTEPGLYPVSLTVNNGNGTDRVTVSVSVPDTLFYSDPEFDYTIGPDGVIQFTDRSGNNPTAWAWDFNNDGIIDATGSSPQYTFEEPGTYEIRVVVTNRYGQKEKVITIVVPVSKAPFAPESLIAELISDSEARLTWSEAKYAEQYQVERKVEAGDFTIVTKTSSRSWTDPDVLPDVHYYYRVRGLNRIGAGAESMTVTIYNETIPPEPDGTFESATLEPWVHTQATLNNLTAFHGSYSAILSGSDGKVQRPIQDLLKPNVEYIFSAWVKVTQKGTGWGSPRLVLSHYEDLGASNFGADLSKNALEEGWQKLTMVRVFRQEDLDREIYFGVRNFGFDGEAIIDDVLFSETGVANSGFETGATENWILGGAPSVTSSDKASGKFSLELNENERIAQDVSAWLVEGVPYQITAKVKISQPGTTGTAQLKVSGSSSFTGNDLGMVDASNDVSDWQKLSMTITFTKEELKKEIYLGFMTEGFDGVALVDDLKIQQDGVHDGGFERLTLGYWRNSEAELSSASYRGLKAVKLGRYGRVSQAVGSRLVPNREYLVTAWVKVVEVGTGWGVPELAIGRYPDLGAAYQKNRAKNNIDLGWQHLSLVKTFTSEELKHQVYMGVNHFGFDGASLVDEISITPIGVENGDFESGRLDGWLSPGTASISQSDSWQGSGSVVLTGNYLSQSLKNRLLPNRDYRFSVRVKILESGTSWGVPRLRLSKYEGLGTHDYGNSDATDDPALGWQLLTIQRRFTETELLGPLYFGVVHFGFNGVSQLDHFEIEAIESTQ